MSKTRQVNRTINKKSKITNSIEMIILSELDQRGVSNIPTNTGWLFDIGPRPMGDNENTELLLGEDECILVERLGFIVGIQHYYTSKQKGNPPKIRITVRSYGYLEESV
jgi:hypothetical protein